jgi:ATPase subunit of ABC transporter with duplicated ATPase domains
LALKQQQDKNKKNENKIKELEDFVRRFSANASKSKQATSRKKMIEKLRPEELPVSRRRSPYIQFDTLRACGTKILAVDSVSYTVDGVPLLSEVNFSVNPGDKIAVIGKNSVSRTALLDIISGVVSPTSGQFEWGETITSTYFPKDNSRFFQKEDILIEWLGQFQSTHDSEQLRGLLGRMLFSGENVNKNVSVLSGGEKARAMFCKMMLEKANAIVLDEPTDHLDLESISALNHALETFSQCLIFTSHDYQILNTVPNRIIEVGPNGIIDRYMLFDDFMKSQKIASLREQLYLTSTHS